MHRQMLAIALTAFMTARVFAQSTANLVAAPPTAIAALPVVEIPAGTKILLDLRSAVNTKSARAGDGVYAVSSFPVVVGSKVLLPTGVFVQGVIDDVVRPGRVKGRAQVHLHFTSMIFPNGQVVMIPGVINSMPGSDGPRVKDAEGTVEQAGSKGKDAGTIARTTAAGAEIGTIAGAATGGLGRGLLLGAATGGIIGLVATLLTRGNDISIPQGTPIEMVLQRPLELQPVAAGGAGTAPSYSPSVSQPKPMLKDKPYSVRCPTGAECN